jgi:hypothetical protein
MEYTMPFAFAPPFLLAAAVAASPNAISPVAYPTGFRDWHHVSTSVVQPGHPLYSAVGGINHIYANALAMKGYASGTFPDGSMLVFDTIEAKEADHAISEGSRKMLGVMVKDASRHAATGGWGFENFAGGDPLKPLVGANASTTCFACHSKPQTRDHVFSRLRE